MATSSPASKRFLQSLLHTQRQRIRLAFGFAVLSAVLLLVQNLFLAWLFALWLHEGVHVVVLWPLILLLSVCWLIRPGLDYLKKKQLQQASLEIRLNLRQRLMEALAVLGPGRHHFGSDGALSSLVLDQVDALDGYIVHYVVQQRLAGLMPLMIAVAVCCFSPLAAALLLLTAPLVPLFMILLGEAAARKNRAQLSALARLSGRFLDLLRGLPTLRRLGAVPQAQQAIDGAAQAYRSRTMQVLQLAFLSTAVLELFSALAIALVAVYLGLGLIGVLPWAIGKVPVVYQGALFILLLAPEFYAPLRQLGADYHDKAKAQAAAMALMPLLEVQSPLSSGQEDYELERAPGLVVNQLRIVTEDGRIRLPATCFELAAGERVLLAGASGSGKSSLLQALLGFVPYQGQIQIDHWDYRQLNLAFLRRFMVYLAQTPPILPLTIAENLRLALPQADDARLRLVLQQVDLWSLVKRLPLGLDTCLGERGLGLSGGQLQRLALAQVLLRPAPLWLLDEPTAHLDASTAMEIMTLLERLSRGKTLILVCHDPQGVSWIDRVIELPDTGELRS